MRALSALSLVLTLVVFVGCSDDPEGTGGDNNQEVNQEPGTNNGPDENNGQEEECEPGEIVGCTGEEQTTYEVCNSEGDGVEIEECLGTSICRDGACEEVTCIPGTGRCVDGGPERCESDGEGDYEFVAQEPCEGDESCEDGVCLDRCAQAEQRDDYVGCEYWAVELDNQLLHSDSDGETNVDPEHRPPFAVVLANTESSESAYVTVEGAGGEVAESIGEREVRGNVLRPGIEFQTVYSETVDEQGQRIAGPHHGPIEDIELPPGATLTLLLPNQTIPFGETTVTQTSYRVETTEPVVAYQFNPFCCNYNFTNDASLLLPASALTENYMMVGHAVWAGEDFVRLPDPRSATLTVVAMEPNTTVEVQLRASESSDQSFEDQLYPVRQGDGIDGPDGSGRLEVELDQFEVFNVAAGGNDPVVDLSGTWVESNNKIAVFSGHTCTNVPFTRSACDHIESQLYPLETWATDFVVAPHIIRNPDPGSGMAEGTYWKFVARDDDTTISADISIAPGDVLNPSGEGVPHCASYSDDPEGGQFQMDRGEYCEFGTQDVFEVQATRPISIAGFMSGQATVFDDAGWGDRAGDPSMFFVPPSNQYRNSYTFLTPPTYFQSYATVIIPDGFDVELDGEVIDPREEVHQETPGGSMVMAHIEVDPGPHQISANVPFGLIVYGVDNYVSYSYAGGLDLTKLNPLD